MTDPATSCEAISDLTLLAYCAGIAVVGFSAYWLGSRRPDMPDSYWSEEFADADDEAEPFEPINSKTPYK